MKALLILTFTVLSLVATANPMDYNQTQCKKAREQLFIVINEGQRFLNDCQLKLIPKCKGEHCYEQTTFQCIEIFWTLRVKAIKKFNKHKCYVAKSE